MLRLGILRASGILYIFFALITFCSSVPTLNQTNTLWNATWPDILRRDLFVNYDKFARPTDHNSVTNLTIWLTIKHIDLDETKAMLTVFGWLRMEWNDDKLKWNPSDYGNLKTLHVADHEIWQPDLSVYNSASGSGMDNYGNTPCLIRNIGTVLWVPPAQLQVFCPLNLRNWPFDTQMCTLIFGSWTYDVTQIDMHYAQENDLNIGASVDTFIENHEWSIKHIATARESKHYDCCVEAYVDIRYNITIERRSPMYKAVVIAPAISVILMTLSCFWLPPQSGEKIFLNGINIVVISMFLMYFAQKLPVMAMHTPLVVLFYSSSLYLVCISMIISIFVLFLSKTQHKREVPWILKNFLNGWFATVLCTSSLRARKHQEQQRDEELREQQFEEITTTAEDRQIINNMMKGSLHQNWIITATAIDRIFFLLYCLIFTVLAVSYSI